MRLDYKNDYLELKVNHKFKGVLKSISDTKHAQEVAMISKIMQLLNDNVYSSIDDLHSKNDSLQTFLKHHFEVPIVHFGYNEPSFNENDYVIILENMRAVIKQKQSVETENIKTANTNGSTFNSMNIDGEQHIIDSTNYQYPNIENKMENIQPDNEEFQTINPEENAENIFKDIESRQEGLNLKRLGEINFGDLNKKDAEMFNFAMNYQVTNMIPIQVDLDKRVFVDENGTITKVIEEDGVLKLENNEKEEQKKEESKHPQKKLVVNPNTIYSN